MIYVGHEIIKYDCELDIKNDDFERDEFDFDVYEELMDLCTDHHHIVLVLKLSKYKFSFNLLNFALNVDNEGSDIDYVIFLQIEPMLRKDKVSTFSKGKEMTATAPFKMLDIKNRKALYNGRITRVGETSTMFFKLGNKSVAMEAIEMINEKVNYEIKKRLPKYKRTDVNAFYQNKSIVEAEASFNITNTKETVNVN